MKTGNILISILSITMLELMALHKGIDGKILTMSISSITFLIGLMYNNKKGDPKNENKIDKR